MLTFLDSGTRAMSAALPATARDLHRLRIPASLQAGLSYDAIDRRSGRVDAGRGSCRQDGKAALDAANFLDFVG
jgi:hypothetical protein